jgi:hypothetical protein
LPGDHTPTDTLETGWGEGDDEKVLLEAEDVFEIQKLIPDLKKCTAYYKCLNDRDAGKVKHCYANDRRWR